MCGKNGKTISDKCVYKAKKLPDKQYACSGGCIGSRPLPQSPDRNDSSTRAKIVIQSPVCPAMSIEIIVNNRQHWFPRAQRMPSFIYASRIHVRSHTPHSIASPSVQTHTLTHAHTRIRDNSACPRSPVIPLHLFKFTVKVAI